MFETILIGLPFAFKIVGISFVIALSMLIITDKCSTIISACIMALVIFLYAAFLEGNNINQNNPNYFISYIDR